MSVFQFLGMKGSCISQRPCEPLEQLVRGKHLLRHIDPLRSERTSGVQKPGLDLPVLLTHLPRSGINLISAAELK